MRRVRAYWKRFVGLVTGFANKYEADAFFRTEVIIVALQAGFVLFLLFAMWLSFQFLQQDVSNTLVSGVMEQIASGKSPHAAELLTQIGEVETKNIVVLSSVIILITLIFGYILAKLTLAHTRNALSSQKQFVGNIAHELRTPLAIIKTNAEVALFDEKLDSEIREVLESSVEELDRASHIIDNLLSLSTLMRPERIEFSNVDLGTVVDTSLAKLAPLIEQKKVDIDLKKTDFLRVRGNVTALEQVVMNLLKNAINYNRPGGHVKIVVEPDYSGHIELSIRDSGMGIPRTDLFHIFEPFYRADQSRSRELGGSGLGLTIVSELLKLHHGKISIQSIRGRGTTVTVLIPCGTRTPTTGKTLGTNDKDFGEVSADFS
ncbi:MAG: HAMP domain-containing sensor histidine kinase [Patescibacteria group bacterium]